MSIFLEIEKRLGDFCLQVKLEAANEVLSLLGASGCGKSMTLKCIAGIEKPDRGRIVVDGVTLFDSKRHINLTPQKRCTGLMFQNYALFPNMTVWQNIRAGTVRERAPQNQEKKIREVMERFELTALAGQYPSQLSGGQQQRTALARILVSGPRILLLDEPFSALDSHLRFRLEREMREVIHDFGKTVLLVSHDRDEVFRLSDKIAVMGRGTVEAFGDKKKVFSHPVTRNAAVLTGCKNISPIRKLDETHVLSLDWDLPLEVDAEIGDAEYIGVRMHDISHGAGQNAVCCEVVEEIENPFSYTVMLRPAGRRSTALIGWELSKEEWQGYRAAQVEIHIPANSLVLLRG